MYVNCVYCGHQYGPGETTPVSMADALKVHVEQCPKHPMSALRAALTERTEERDRLAGTVGAAIARRRHQKLWLSHMASCRLCGAKDGAEFCPTGSEIFGQFYYLNAALDSMSDRADAALTPEAEK